MLKVRKVKNFSLHSESITDSNDYFNKAISIDHRISNINSPIPSVTHLDGSARVQTVNKNDKRFVKDVLVSFHEITGCPLLINTSFNVRGEPIVGSPLDALRCLATTGIDVLYIEGYIIDKDVQTNEFLSQFTPAVSDD
jgi:carbamoyltransferase